MTQPADPEPPRPDETKPRMANPSSQGGVLPPSPTGTPRWRRPAIVAAAVVAILLILVLVT